MPEGVTVHALVDSEGAAATAESEATARAGSAVSVEMAASRSVLHAVAANVIATRTRVCTVISQEVVEACTREYHAQHDGGIVRVQRCSTTRRTEAI